MDILIKNATVVNEGEINTKDIYISNQRIERIDDSISLKNGKKALEIDASGMHLFPGMIDDQVHFRDPGLTYKADIESESRAAVAGGITSFMDMPNTLPNTLTLELLEEKYKLAASKSVANYSFFMGINKHNLEEALKIDNTTVCGITDDGLYFNDDEGILANHPQYLEKLFSKSASLIALHSENDKIINDNTKKYTSTYGNEIPFKFHSQIRSNQACLSATRAVIDISKKYNNRLHFFHISTLDEVLLFENTQTVREKRITSEACIHHLFFSENDYTKLGSLIKWNPSIKTEGDRKGLLKGLLSNHIDLIATDHAPHSIAEKEGNYFQAHSGGPLVQHALPALITLYHKGEISLEKIAEKIAHHPAEAYRIKERGYIREGYYADLVLIDINKKVLVDSKNILYKCKWSPFNGFSLNGQINHTLVNGTIVYSNGNINSEAKGQRLLFEKIR